MGGEEFKWCQLKHNQLMSSHGPHFSPRSTAKTNDKSTNLKIARNDGFSRVPEIDFRYETKARKVMVDFKFYALLYK